MRCEEIMKTDVECVSPEDTAQDAAQCMRDENIGFLPVCDPSKRVLGTITDRDLAVRVLADARAPTTAVDEIYSHEVISCRPQDDVREAEELMAENHKSRIVCLDDDGKLAGVISLSDIVQTEEDAIKAAQILRQVSEREARS